MTAWHHINLWMLILGLTIFYRSQAQEIYSPDFIEIASECTEDPWIFTDRNLYAVDEPVRFTALVRRRPYPLNAPASRVLYAELVSADGESVAGGKYALSEGRATGRLIIPGSVATGRYYLKCYTRWMRNYGPGGFAYVPLTIVNPYSNRVVVPPNNEKKGELLPEKEDAFPVRINTGSSSFSPGEPVDLSITIPAPGPGSVQGCLTVVETGTADTIALRYRPAENGDSSRFCFNYLPDLEGMILSGIVTASGKSDPVRDTWVHFSMLGDDPGYFVAKSNDEGRFVVRIPEITGIREMIMIPGRGEGLAVEVRIDNDFSPEPLPFSSPSFRLTEETRKLASGIAFRTQLEQAYMEDAPADSNLNRVQEPLPFYGVAALSITLEEFIDLPNLDEVFENLVPGVAVIRNKEESFIRISGDNSMISLYPPLILVDGIPVLDMAEVLAIPPTRIAKIAVVPQVYILGEARFGGIISLTSLKGDLAGVNLSDDSYFFDFRTLEPIPPERIAKSEEPRANPEIRNTLLWEDRIILEKDSPFRVNFNASREPGSYLALFRGVSANGEPVLGSLTFTVK